MKTYLDMDEILRHCRRCIGQDIYDNSYMVSSVPEEVIRSLSPADVVEVVRCKDCKHRRVNEHYGEKGYLRIKAMCELDTGDPFELSRCASDDDWFCADGERKDEE